MKNEIVTRDLINEARRKYNYPYNIQYCIIKTVLELIGEQSDPLPVIFEYLDSKRKLPDNELILKYFDNKVPGANIASNLGMSYDEAIYKICNIITDEAKAFVFISNSGSLDFNYNILSLLEYVPVQKIYEKAKINVYDSIRKFLFYRRTSHLYISAGSFYYAILSNSDYHEVIPTYLNDIKDGLEPYMLYNTLYRRKSYIFRMPGVGDKGIVYLIYCLYVLADNMIFTSKDFSLNKDQYYDPGMYLLFSDGKNMPMMTEKKFNRFYNGFKGED